MSDHSTAGLAAYAGLPMVFTLLDDNLNVVAQVNHADTALQREPGTAFEMVFGQQFGPRAALEQCKSTGASIRFQASARDQSGSTYHYENEALPEPQGRGTLVVSIDISDRIEQEMAVLSEVDGLHAILDAVQAGVIVYDHDLQIITYANQYMLDLFELTLEDIPKGYLRSLLHPDDFAAFVRYATEVRPNLRDGQSAVNEWRLQTPRGDMRWVSVRDIVRSRHADGRVREILGVLVDITERKTLEANLAQASRRFEAIFKSTSDAVVISTVGTSYDESRYVAANHQMERLSGYTLDELRTVRPSELIVEGDVPTAISRRQSLLDPETEQEYHLQERQTRHKDGSIRYVESAGFFIRDDTGQPTETLVLARDITERKRREQQILDAKIAAEAALRARDAFVANISHELRTPVNTIQGYVQLMLDDPQLPASTAQNLLHVDYSASFLNRLIADVLDLSRVEAGLDVLRLRTFNPRETLTRLYGTLRVDAARRRLRLRLDIDDDLPEQIQLDEVKLKQVLVNLVDNAIMYTAQGDIAISVGANGDALDIRVTDTGPGIDSAALSQLAEAGGDPDADAGEPVGGLGLMISKRLIDLMSGSFRFGYRAGGGARVNVTLPYTVPEDGSSDSRPPLERPDARASLDILVLYDRTDPPFVATYLESRGQRVTVVPTTAEALEAVDTMRVDLILIDVSTALGTDLSAVHAVRSRSTAPTIVITASTEPAHEQALNAASAVVLVKPFRLRDLNRLIGRLLDIDFAERGPAELSQPGDAVRLPARTLADLSAQPAEWIAALHGAAVAGDHHRVLRLIDEIAGDCPETIEALRHLAERFHTARIANLIDSLDRQDDGSIS